VFPVERDKKSSILFLKSSTLSKESNFSSGKRYITDGESMERLLFKVFIELWESFC